MLGKLFRYEWKATGRILFPLYGAALLMGLVSALFFHFFPRFNWENFTFMRVAAVIAGVMFFCLIAASLGMSLVFSILRFKRNLLGNEGYLMNTLPVSTWHNVGAKLMVAVIFQWLSLLVAAASGILFIVVGSSQGLLAFFQELPIMFHQLFQYMTFDWWLLIIEGIILMLLVTVDMNVMFYAAISVGHSATDHKVLKSVAAYIGFYIAAQLINSMALLPFLSFSVNMNQPFQMAMAHRGALILCGIEVFYIVVYLIVTNFFLKRKLNLQ